MAVLHQLRIECLLVGSEPSQRGFRRAVFGDPPIAVGKQRVTVHEHRTRLRQPRAQSVEDREPVGVDVAPVQDLGVGQPSQPTNLIDIESFASEHDAVGGDVDGQIRDLVLDDDRDPRFDGQLRQLLGTYSQFGQRRRQAQRCGGT